MDGNYISHRPRVLAMSAAGISEMLCSAGELLKAEREEMQAEREIYKAQKQTAKDEFPRRHSPLLFSMICL